MYKSDLEAAHAQIKQLKDQLAETKTKKEKKSKLLLSERKERMLQALAVLLGLTAALGLWAFTFWGTFWLRTVVDDATTIRLNRADIALEICKDKTKHLVADHHKVQQIAPDDDYLCKFFLKGFGDYGIIEWSEEEVKIRTFEIDANKQNKISNGNNKL